ncbi:MAG: hypothetical protein ABSB81_01200 [Halobacteriota archaeon]|jgi:hypothetical protein
MIRTEKILEAEKMLEVSLSALQEIVQDIMDDPKLDEFLVYLEKIECTDEECQARVLNLIKQYKMLSIKKIDRIFITNYVIGDKTYFDNFWMFSDKRCFEISDFFHADKIKSLKLKNQVESWVVEKAAYGFKDFEGDYYTKSAASDSSKLSLSVILKSGKTLDFKAARKNCDFLYAILKDYIIENEC